MNTSHGPDLAHRLVLRAAHKAPAELAERLEEEWLADLATRNGSLARLRLALGCCWATNIITHDFRVPQLAASGAAGGAKHLLAELPFNLPQLSRRSIAFLVIASVHVLLIYAFIFGLKQHFTLPKATETQGVVIESEHHVDHNPRPVPTLTATSAKGPKLAPIVLRQVDIPIDVGIPADLPSRGIEGTSEPPVAPSVVRAVGGPGKGFPATDDFYPSVSRRLAETGAAKIQVCVDTQGRLTGEPKLAGSSGNVRLDAGALNLARAGSGHYRPSTENGRAVSSCYDYRIRFELH